MVLAEDRILPTSRRRFVKSSSCDGLVARCENDTGFRMLCVWLITVTPFIQCTVGLNSRLTSPRSDVPMIARHCIKTLTRSGVRARGKKISCIFCKVIFRPLFRSNQATLCRRRCLLQCILHGLLKRHRRSFLSDSGERRLRQTVVYDGQPALIVGAVDGGQGTAEAASMRFSGGI